MSTSLYKYITAWTVGRERRCARPLDSQPGPRLAQIFSHPRHSAFTDRDDAILLALPLPDRKRPAFAVQVVTDFHMDPYTQPMVFFLAETGVRSGEMIIEIPDVDLVERKITIRQAIWRGEIDTPKTDSGIRGFHISERLTKMLIEYIGDRKTGPVFASRTGTPIDMHNFCSRGLAAARKAANVGCGDIHTFRHFNATLMDSLKTPGAVKRLRLGHAGVTVTEGYEDVIEKDEQAAAEQIASMIWTHVEPKLCPDRTQLAQGSVERRK